MPPNGGKVQSGLRLQTTSQPVTGPVDTGILTEWFSESFRALVVTLRFQMAGGMIEAASGWC